MLEIIDKEITFLGKDADLSIIEGFSSEDTGFKNQRGRTTTVESLCKYIEYCSEQIKRASKIIEKMSQPVS